MIEVRLSDKDEILVSESVEEITTTVTPLTFLSGDNKSEGPDPVVERSVADLASS